MHRSACFLCALSLLAAAACGEETPVPNPGTTGATSATTSSTATSTGGGTSTTRAETSGSAEATTSTGVGTSGTAMGTSGATTHTGGETNVTGETNPGTNGDTTGSTTSDISVATGSGTGDAGIASDSGADSGQAGETGSKLCSEIHASGGCDTEMIAACVCEGPAAGVEGEPSCCEPAVSDDDASNGWDEVCQIIAYTEGCAGNCCEIHEGGSCDLPSVEKCVCDALPECCLPADDSQVTQNGWDALCLAAAAACGAPCI